MIIKKKLTIISLLIAIKNKEQKSLINDDYKTMDSFYSRNITINDKKEKEIKTNNKKLN